MLLKPNRHGKSGRGICKKSKKGVAMEGGGKGPGSAFRAGKEEVTEEMGDSVDHHEWQRKG